LIDREKVKPEVKIFSPLTPRGVAVAHHPSDGGIENGEKIRNPISYQRTHFQSIKQKELPHWGRGGLYHIAHSRAGDKGNISTLSLIPYDVKNYELLCQKVTVEKVKAHLKDIVSGEIVRYEMPNISALLFVCQDALLTGVTTSLAIDTHGKALSYALLEMEIE
jgi:hypothetical protein